MKLHIKVTSFHILQLEEQCKARAASLKTRFTCPLAANGLQ